MRAGLRTLTSDEQGYQVGQLTSIMSLKKFSLPGKDSRLVRFAGQVFKIRVLMPPPSKKNVAAHVSEQTLQEEIEDAIRAVLAIPPSVEPVLMRTDHLVVKPERKEWKLPQKVDFRHHDKLLEAHPCVYILNLNLIENTDKAIGSSVQHAAREVQQKGEGDMTSQSLPVSRGSTSKHQNPAPQNPPGPGSNITRSNKRRVPPRGCTMTSGEPERFKVRKRALRLSSKRRLRKLGNCTTPLFSPDAEDIEEEEKEEEKEGSKGGVGMERDGVEDDSTRGRADEAGRDRRGREQIETSRRSRDREGSPELEAGFSVMAHGRASRGPENPEQCGDDEVMEPKRSYKGCPSTGDEGPVPVRPSDRETANVGVVVHPGRERVERHVLSEQLRLQEMARAAGDTSGNATPEDHAETQGVVHRMIGAFMTPVKNLFS